MCSGEELCLKEGDYPGAEVYGILILQGDWAPGTDLREVLDLNDVIIDFSILSNRPDCQQRFRDRKRGGCGSEGRVPYAGPHLSHRGWRHQ